MKTVELVTQVTVNQRWIRLTIIKTENEIVEHNDKTFTVCDI